MENHILVSNLNISSELGDNCWYLHHAHEDTGPFGNDGWWNSKEIVYLDRIREKNGRVVKLNDTPSWGELDLDWPSADDKPSVIKLFKDEN